MDNVKNQKGMTLIEMMMAIAIFAVAFMMATSIFLNVVEGQRSAVSAQNTQQSLSYAFEIMSKEIRHAQKLANQNECSPLFAAGNKIYTPGASNDILFFKNKNNVCVKYELLLNGRLQISRCLTGSCANPTVLAITPDEVKINSLNFIIDDNSWVSALNSIQPRVTFTIDAETAGGKAAHKQPIKVQTTISSRYY